MASKQRKTADFDTSTVERNSSLRETNNAISTIQQNANDAFFKSYKEQQSPDPESPGRKNYRTYPYDYFSGIDAKVFFGDVWVDDIVTIQYTVSQNKVPIYGYASQLYDAVARGTVIVNGSLTIAFKEMGYLNMVQRLIETQQRGAQTALEQTVREYAKKANDRKLQFIPNLQGTPDRNGQNVGGLNGLGFSPTGTAQIIRQNETIETILQRAKGGNKYDGNVVSAGLGAAYLNETNPNGNRDFEDFAEILEDTIWGDSQGRPLGKTLKYRRADEFDYKWGPAGQDTGAINIGRDDYARCLNILMTFGDTNDFRAEHTVVALNDVHFVSQSTILSPTGDPIGETYNFFARDINQNITSSTFNVPEIKFQVGNDINPSKIEDIQELEKFLAYKDTFKKITVYTVASFKEGEEWRTERHKVASLTNEPNQPPRFSFNSREPLSDQVMSLVERMINNVADSTLETEYSQHILEVVFDENIGENEGEVWVGSHEGVPTSAKVTALDDEMKMRSGTRARL